MTVLSAFMGGIAVGAVLVLLFVVIGIHWMENKG